MLVEGMHHPDKRDAIVNRAVLNQEHKSAKVKTLRSPNQDVQRRFSELEKPKGSIDTFASVCNQELAQKPVILYDTN